MKLMAVSLFAREIGLFDSTVRVCFCSSVRAPCCFDVPRQILSMYHMMLLFPAMCSKKTCGQDLFPNRAGSAEGRHDSTKLVDGYDAHMPRYT